MAGLPKAWWHAIGWCIGLFALASAIGVLESAYQDIYDLGLCDAHKRADERAGKSLESCEQTRLMAAAAGVGKMLFRVPAVGILIVAVLYVPLRNSLDGRPADDRVPDEEAEPEHRNASEDTSGPAATSETPKKRRSKRSTDPGATPRAKVSKQSAPPST